MSENKLFGNYASCTSPVSFTDHYKGGSDIRLFLKVSESKREPGNMRCYSLCTIHTGLINGHSIGFKFYIQKNILNGIIP